VRLPQRRWVRAVGAVVALASLASGCSVKAREPYQDAPRGGSVTGPADVITFPDGFSNVSAKCDGPNRVYVIFHGDTGYGSVAVAPNDPRCGR
jgi:hypothetical protein